MGSLFEELEAREAAARARVEEFEAELAAVSAKLELAREGLERLRIARETVAEVLAEMTPQTPAVTVDAAGPPAGERMASAYAGAERQVIGVLTVPNWQPGMGADVLPAVYRDIVEVVTVRGVRHAGRGPMAGPVRVRPVPQTLGGDPARAHPHFQHAPGDGGPQDRGAGARAAAARRVAAGGAAGDGARCPARRERRSPARRGGGRAGRWDCLGAGGGRVGPCGLAAGQARGGPAPGVVPGVGPDAPVPGGEVGVSPGRAPPGAAQRSPGARRCPGGGVPG